MIKMSFGPIGIGHLEVVFNLRLNTNFVDRIISIVIIFVPTLAR